MEFLPPKKSSPHAKSGFSVVSALVAVSIMAMAMVAFVKFFQQSNKSSDSTRLRVTMSSLEDSVRNMVAGRKYMDFVISAGETRAFLKSCLRPSGAVCPPAADLSNFPDIAQKYAGRHVVEVPIVDGRLEMIAGTSGSPKFWTREGNPCDSRDNTRCRIETRGFAVMDAQNDPGNVEFVMSTRPVTHGQLASAPIAPRQSVIPIGESWNNILTNQIIEALPNDDQDLTVEPMSLVLGGAAPVPGAGLPLALPGGLPLPRTPSNSLINIRPRNNRQAQVCPEGSALAGFDEKGDMVCRRITSVLSRKDRVWRFENNRKVDSKTLTFRTEEAGYLIASGSMTGFGADKQGYLRSNNTRTLVLLRVNGVTCGRGSRTMAEDLSILQSNEVNCMMELPAGEHTIEILRRANMSNSLSQEDQARLDKWKEKMPRCTGFGENRLRGKTDDCYTPFITKESQLKTRHILLKYLVLSEGAGMAPSTAETAAN